MEVLSSQWLQVEPTKPRMCGRKVGHLMSKIPLLPKGTAYEFTAKIRMHQDTADPERVRMYIDHPKFTDANDEHPGMQIVFTARPQSADYNPNNFNRVYALLCDAAGVPVQRVKEFSRLLRLRKALIEKYDKGLI